MLGEEFSQKNVALKRKFNEIFYDNNDSHCVIKKKKSDAILDLFLFL